MSLLEGWAEASIGEIAELVRGVTYDKVSARNLAENGLVPILRATNIQDGRLDAEDLVYVPSHFVGGRQKLRDGDILIATSSGSRRVVGKAAKVGPKHQEMSFGAFCGVVRAHEKEIDGWLSKVLAGREYRAFVEAVAIGTNINNLRSIDLLNFKFPLPPKAEQRRIVAKLDALTTRLARARAELDRVPRLANTMREQSLGKAFAVSGESLPRTEASEDAIDERTKPLHAIPSDWRWSALGSIGAVTGGLTKNAGRANLPSRAKYLRVANVYANRLALDDVAEIGCTTPEFERTKLKEGDILIVEGNGSLQQVGRAALWRGEVPNCSHQNHILKLRVGDAVTAAYALWWLLSPRGREKLERLAASTSGLHTLSISKIAAMPIPVAPKTEQIKIVAGINAAFARADRLEAEAARARALLDRLEAALLAKAFRGELVPQDPNDEPASVLLDRIRAERAAAPKVRRGRKPKGDAADA